MAQLWASFDGARHVLALRTGVSMFAVDAQGTSPTLTALCAPNAVLTESAPPTLAACCALNAVLTEAAPTALAAI